MSNGSATLEESLGTVEISLNNLNSTLLELSGENATLSSSLGILNLSLKASNTTITSYGSSVSRLNGGHNLH
ncbi:MAG: hypothetical protein QXN66_03355 [Thermoplasmatales archaeon]